MPTTKTQIEQLARALFPRYGIKDVGSLVATIVKYRHQDGHVKIWRPEGSWGWFASPAKTSVTPGMITLGFPADYRRDTAQARGDLYRQLEDASLSVMSEDEVEAATGPARRHQRPGAPRGSATLLQLPVKPPEEKSVAQIEREVKKVLSIPPLSNLGMARAERLAQGLRALGHEAQAFRQYGMWNSVGVHRRAPAGDWRQIVTFLDDGRLQPPAGGPAYGTGNPWRYGPEHDLVEEVARWVP